MLWAAAHAGDINGDGMDDLLMGASSASMGDEYNGKVYIFFGRPDRWGSNTSAAAADITYWGEQAGDGAGFGVANGGDLDGDGFADVIVGAAYNSQGGEHAGKVYVIYGHVDMEPGGYSLAEVPHCLVGEWPGDVAGVSVASIGDVNGDGLDDMAVDSLGNVEGGKEAGQVYVILGNEVRLGDSVDLGDVDASFLGRPRDWLGFRLSGKGDVNGDGLDDLSLGAPEQGIGRGRAYLVFGSHGGWQMDSYVSDLDCSYQGEALEDALGVSSAIVGDVDGDGLDDWVIGASGNGTLFSDSGRVYLVYGRTQGWSDDGAIQDHADVIFDGEASSDYLGAYAAGIGDFNADGLSDFAFSAHGSNDGGTYSGQTYLLLGRRAGWEGGTLSASDADISLAGEDPEDLMGAVYGGGDLDGDGFADLVTSAPYNSDFHENAGKVYVVYGSACWDVDWDGHDSCSDDCDDNDASTYPEAPELCDELDNDCDGEVDEHTDEDQDGDGFTVCEGDCDDADPGISPGAEEIADELDNDCDGEVDEDLGDDDDDDAADDDDVSDDDVSDDDDTVGDDDDQAADDDTDDGLCCGCSADGGSVRSTPLFLLSLALAVGARRRLTRSPGANPR